MKSTHRRRFESLNRRKIDDSYFRHFDEAMRKAYARMPQELAAELSTFERLTKKPDGLTTREAIDYHNSLLVANRELFLTSQRVYIIIGRMMDEDYDFSIWREDFDFRSTYDIDPPAKLPSEIDPASIIYPDPKTWKRSPSFTKGV